MRALVSEPDWGSIAGAWLTEWGELPATRCAIGSLRACGSIGAQPRGFFTGGARMNLKH